MPIVYRADKALGCTIAVWDGDLTSEDMQQQMIDLANDPEWPPGPSHLVDSTTLGTVIIPDPGLLELVYEGTNLVRQIRIAVVARPEFFDETSTQFRIATDAFNAETFTDVESACEYLALSTTAVESIIDQLRQQLSEAPA
jgi:hypothetical protein